MECLKSYCHVIHVFVCVCLCVCVCVMCVPFVWSHFAQRLKLVQVQRAIDSQKRELSDLLALCSSHLQYHDPNGDVRVRACAWLAIFQGACVCRCVHVCMCVCERARARACVISGTCPMPISCPRTAPRMKCCMCMCMCVFACAFVYGCDIRLCVCVCVSVIQGSDADLMPTHSTHG